MVFQVRSLGLQGVSGYEVSAECDLSSGLPAFTLVGLPDAAVNEARERVRSASMAATCRGSSIQFFSRFSLISSRASRAAASIPACISTRRPSK